MFHILSKLSQTSYQFFCFVLFMIFALRRLNILHQHCINIMILQFFSKRDYESLKKLVAAVQRHVKNQNYAIVNKRFKKKIFFDEKCKCVLICDRENHIKRKFNSKFFKFERKFRKTKFKKCDCEFKINVIYKRYLKIWNVNVRTSHHNHEFVESKNLKIVSILRNLEKIDEFYDRMIVVTRTNTSIQFIDDNNNWRITNQIFAQIMNAKTQFNFNIKLIIENIYNAKKTLCRKKLNRYTFIQILLKTLHRRRWFVKIKLRKKINEIKRMFFVDKNVIKIFIKNSNILIVDCTYKINKYKMFLMIIANQIELKAIFFINFVFISNEKKNNFAWVIEQIKNLYKNLDLKNSKIVFIDRDETLMRVINDVYFKIHMFFCIWHIVMSCQHSNIENRMTSKIDIRISTFIRRNVIQTFWFRKIYHFWNFCFFHRHDSTLLQYQDITHNLRIIIDFLTLYHLIIRS